MPFPIPWANILKPETIKLANALEEKAQQKRSEGQIIFPEQQNVFRAFQLVSPEECKVIIIGQDPYINVNQANGLAFAVNSGIPCPPSLKNIFRELSDDIGDVQIDETLIHWAEQGVLLVNTCLTVRSGFPASHSGWGWESVITDALKAVVELENSLVIIAWGRHAQNVTARLPVQKNQLLLCSSHPSPLGATKPCGQYPSFIGSKPFSKTNRFLSENNLTPIDW